MIIVSCRDTPRALFRLWQRAWWGCAGLLHHDHLLSAMTAVSRAVTRHGLDRIRSVSPPSSSGNAVMGISYRLPGEDPAVGYLSSPADCEDESTFRGTTI